MKRNKILFNLASSLILAMVPFSTMAIDHPNKEVTVVGSIDRISPDKVRLDIRGTLIDVDHRKFNSKAQLREGMQVALLITLGELEKGYVSPAQARKGK